MGYGLSCGFPDPYGVCYMVYGIWYGIGPAVKSELFLGSSFEIQIKISICSGAARVSEYE